MSVISFKKSVFSLGIIVFIYLFITTAEASYSNEVDTTAPYEDSGYLVVVNNDYFLDGYNYSGGEWVEREPRFDNTGALPSGASVYSGASYQGSLASSDSNENIMGYDSNGLALIDPNSALYGQEINVVSSFTGDSDYASDYEKKVAAERFVQGSYSLSSQKRFLVDVTREGNYFTTVNFKCVAISDHATVWTPTDSKYLPISTADGVEIAAAFDDKYLDMINYYGDAFGSTALTEITGIDEADPDNDNKIAILCYDIEKDFFGGYNSYFGGYFYSLDLDKGIFGYDSETGAAVYGNGTDMIHIDSAQGMSYNSISGQRTPSDAYTTLFHELQHLIAYMSVGQYYMDIPMFLNEAFSESTTHLLFGEDENIDRINYYNSRSSNHTTSLTFWEGSLSNYSLSYIFSQYLRTQHINNEEFYKDFYDYLEQVYILARDEYLNSGGNPNENITISADIIMQLLGMFYNITPETLIENFYIALAAKEASGPFGFNGEEFAYAIDPVATTGYTASGTSLKCGAAMYINKNAVSAFSPSINAGSNIEFYLSSYNPSSLDLYGDFITSGYNNMPITVSVEFFDEETNSFRVMREYIYEEASGSFNIPSLPLNDNYQIVFSKDMHADVTITEINLLSSNANSLKVNMGVSPIIKLPYGDVTGDGNIDFSDLSTIRNQVNYNKTVEESAIKERGDLTGDGIINFSDLSTVRNQSNYNKYSGKNEYSFE